MEHRFTLPWPPSVNSYWHHTKTGATYVSQNGKIFRSDAAAAVFKSCGGIPTKMFGKLSMQLGLYPPDKRPRDADNFCKGVLDALAHACVYTNDCQIKRLEIEMHEPVGKPGRCEITVKEI